MKSISTLPGKKSFSMRFLACIFALSTTLSMFSADKLTGTPIGSNPSRAGQAFDGNTSTVYRASEGSYSWVGLDLGEPYIISKVSWTAGSNSTTKLGVFQGANSPDFSDAVPIWVIRGDGSGSAQMKCSRGFRYVRYVGPADSYSQIAEVEFYGDKGAGDDSALWQITNLPTVSINTVNGEIPYDKEHDISSTVIIISENGSNILQQSKTNIRERGNFSRSFPKKPWRIKFDKKQNVLDAPAKAKKWTLINNYGDKTLMRNKLAFDIANKLGMEWVPFCAFVDVVLNGEYKGCYQLCDQVEVNTGRVDIDEMEPADISGDALTGGYLVEIDAYAYDEPVYFVTDHYRLPVTIKSPDDDVITNEQFNYIKNYFNMLEPMMKDTNPVSGYRSVFDNESFIQHMLVNEVAGNTDTYWSTYMYKRRNDPKIYTGPVWDFDIAFNNDYRTYPIEQRSPNGYLWNTGLGSYAGDGQMIYFAQRILLKDESTASETLDVWSRARDNGLSKEWLLEKIDEYSSQLAASQRLNFTRWPILWEQVHMNPRALGTYEAECKALKDYISARMPQLDDIIGYDESTSEALAVEVESNEGEPEYYTIDGIRANQPLAPGIYIERRGTTTKKIVIRN